MNFWCHRIDVSTLEGSTWSLAAGELIVGDLLYVPPCSLIIEKAVGANNVAMRIMSLVCNTRTQEVYQRYTQLLPTRLVFILRQKPKALSPFAVESESRSRSNSGRCFMIILGILSHKAYVTCDPRA